MHLQSIVKILTLEKKREVKGRGWWDGWVGGGWRFSGGTKEGKGLPDTARLLKKRRYQ